MNCKDSEKLLMQYIDNELKNEEKTGLQGHLDSCPDCLAAYRALLLQNEQLRALPLIMPSSHFRAGLWQKIRVSRLHPLPRFLWIPLPVAAALIFFIMFQFSTFSRVLSAQEVSVKKEIAGYALKNMIMAPAIAPLALANFCKKSYEYVCRCARQENTGQECMCGSCGMHTGGRK